jgi:sugar lactone lactonase YvrE
MKKLFLVVLINFLGIGFAEAQNCANVQLVKPRINGRTEANVCSGVSVTLSAVRGAIYREAGLFAGTRDAGSSNGTRQNATFHQPSGMAFDPNGNLYVADIRNAKIRKIAPNGQVTTYAGTGVQGNDNGNREVATFITPLGICSDTAGNIYVADYDGCVIRKIAANGIVSTLAGDGIRGFANGTGEYARFNRPKSVAMGPDGFLYVADSYNNRIRKISPTGVVTTFAGGSTAGTADGSLLNARFNNTSTLLFDRNGNLLVCDEFNNVVRKINMATGMVSTLAGSYQSGYLDGADSLAMFNAPNGLAQDAAGNIYISDAYNNKIRVLNTRGVVSTLAGGSAGYQSGLVSAALFNTPEGLIFDGDGALIVSDKMNNCIRRISKNVVGSVLWSNGATTNEINASETGNYTFVQIFEGCTTQNSDTARITITTRPARPVIVAERRSICIGEYADLVAPEGLSYLWSNGDTSRILRTGVAGRFSLVTINGACTSEVSEPVDIIVDGPARPSILVSVPAERICLGTRVRLSSSIQYDRYLWSNGETTPSINVTTNGFFTLQGGNGQNCFSLPSSIVTVQFDTVFCLLEISRYGLDSLEANLFADRYTWYLNGIQLLAGNNGRRIAIQGEGVYSVVATVNGITSSSSNPFLITSSKAKALNSVKVYPNPSEGRFTISGLSETDSVEIFTIAGKKVKATINKQNTSIEISGLVSGYYLAKVSGTNNTTLKLQVK